MQQPVLCRLPVCRAARRNSDSRNRAGYRRPSPTALGGLIAVGSRRPIFPTGTLTSASGGCCAVECCAGACSEPQLSQPPQAPAALPADAASSRCAVRRSRRKAGARAVNRLKAPSKARRRLRGPSAVAAYPALTISARPTRELSRMPFMRHVHPEESALAIVYVIHDPRYASANIYAAMIIG
jgi:hypothetical protein